MDCLDDDEMRKSSCSVHHCTCIIFPTCPRKVQVQVIAVLLRDLEGGILSKPMATPASLRYAEQFEMSFSLKPQIS